MALTERLGDGAVASSFSGQSASTHQPIRPDNWVTRPVNILLVDDHPLMRAAIRAVIVFMGTSNRLMTGRIDECASLAEAMTRLGEHTGHDLILTDLTLPDAHGTQAVARLRSVAANVPIIVVSGESRLPLIREALERGAKGFVVKDAAVATLGDAIITVLNGDLFVPPNAAAATRRLSAGSALAKLTERQHVIARLAAAGHTNKAIGRRVSVSEDTIKYHLRQIYCLLGISGRPILRSVLDAQNKARSKDPKGNRDAG